MRIINIPWRDIRRETYRGSGKGGQNRNKRDTCIRLTHILTGITVQCCDQRSQGQNEKIAIGRLEKKLQSYYQEDKERYQCNEVVRTYNQPDNRILDHSSGKVFTWKETVGKLDLLEPIEACFKSEAWKKRPSSGRITGMVD